MSTQGTDLVPLDQLERMATVFAKSKMFGAKEPEQVMALLMLAQAEGIHPATAMRDFDVIQGRPAKKAEAMLRSFIAAGGKVEWHDMTDTLADATFSHDSGGSARITWDMERAKKAGLTGKDMYAKYPRQMLANRCISEGCRRIYPASTSGLYVPEEVRQMAPVEKDMGTVEVVEPEATPEETAKVEEAHRFALGNCTTLAELATAWEAIPKRERPKYAPYKDERKKAMATQPRGEI